MVCVCVCIFIHVLPGLSHCTADGSHLAVSETGWEVTQLPCCRCAFKKQLYVIESSPKMAKELPKTHNANFSKRPGMAHNHIDSWFMGVQIWKRIHHIQMWPSCLLCSSSNYIIMVLESPICKIGCLSRRNQAFWALFWLPTLGLALKD